MMAHSSQQLGDIYREAGECDRRSKNYDRSLELYEAMKLITTPTLLTKENLQCFSDLQQASGT